MYGELRNDRISTDVSRMELDIIHEKMSKAGIKSRSAFLRQMALSGYVIQLDLEPLQRVAALLANATNNVNQIAKRLNGGESVFGLRGDILEMREGYTQMRRELGCIFDELKALTGEGK